MISAGRIGITLMLAAILAAVSLGLLVPEASRPLLAYLTLALGSAGVGLCLGDLVTVWLLSRHCADSDSPDSVGILDCGRDVESRPGFYRDDFVPMESGCNRDSTQSGRNLSGGRSRDG